MKAETLPGAAASLIAATRHYSRRCVAEVGQRLARSLRRRLSGPDTPSATPTPGPNPAPNTTPRTAAPSSADIRSSVDEALSTALAFADAYARALPPDVVPPTHHPLLRLAAAAPDERVARGHRDLLLLACLPEAHEGHATLCRLLNPAGRPWATVALALSWLEDEAAADGDGLPDFGLRDTIEDLLCHAPPPFAALLQLNGDGPWHSRELRAADGVWAALNGRPPQTSPLHLTGGLEQVPGLEDWLESPSVSHAVAALRQARPCHVVLSGGNAAMRATRVRALLGRAGMAALHYPVAGCIDGASLATAQALAFLHVSPVWLEVRDDAPYLPSNPSTGDAGETIHAHGLPLIHSTPRPPAEPAAGVPFIHLPVHALPASARRRLWLALLPQLGDHASELAARYPVDPVEASAVVRDLGLDLTRNPSPTPADTLAAIGTSLRARSPSQAHPGIRLQQPQAQGDALLLPAAGQAALDAAIDRVRQQITVLDDWGFASAGAGRRGVRMLFYGPPGTGKTLAAEVMAHALGVDLMVVDLAGLVSKWIGETEKQLAAVFDLAERARTLLLFDEADALFARRTETQDAHDRYANLETAYLLQRLERFEGVAVLTTNLRSNLDKAFTRRFEFIVEFPEPDADTRAELWRLHLPASAPQAPDVDLTELAAWYPITGAQIRNAALGAGFLAAAQGSAIQRDHLLQAIEREYDKAGRAHPGFPPTPTRRCR